MIRPAPGARLRTLCVLRHPAGARVHTIRSVGYLFDPEGKARKGED